MTELNIEKALADSYIDRRDRRNVRLKVKKKDGRWIVKVVSCRAVKISYIL